MDATSADQFLTVGKDFYYQWQYSTDYQENAGTDYTATWINFSAPTVGDDGRTIRVTIGDANTAFRVVAMPYGNYMYPATGVVTEAVCGNSERLPPPLIPWWCAASPTAASSTRATMCRLRLRLRPAMTL